MTVRIAVSFLAIFAASLIAAPVKTLAGGGFTGAHAMAFQGGVGLPIGRPAIAHIQGERFANFPESPALCWSGRSGAGGVGRCTLVRWLLIYLRWLFI